MTGSRGIKEMIGGAVMMSFISIMLLGYIVGLFIFTRDGHQFLWAIITGSIPEEET